VAGTFAAGPSIGTITGVVILVFLDVLDLEKVRPLASLILALIAN